MIFGRAVAEDVEEEAPDKPSRAGNIKGHRPSPVQSRLSSDHHYHHHHHHGHHQHHHRHQPFPSESEPTQYESMHNGQTRRIGSAPDRRHWPDAITIRGAIHVVRPNVVQFAWFNLCGAVTTALQQ